MRRLLAFVAAAALSNGAALLGAGVVETRALRGAEAALDAEDLDFASVAADGLGLRLTGTAPDEAARLRALTAVGRATDPAWVEDAMEVARGVAFEPPSYAVEMLRGADGVSLIGLVPVATDREAVRGRLARATEAPISDFLELADHPVGASWDRAFDFAIDATARLPRSKISVEPGRVAITAAAGSPEERRALLRDLARARPEGVSLDLDVTAPRPVVAPFTLRFEIADGAPRLAACVAATEAGAAEIEAVARSVGAAASECPLGLGAPSPRWPEAARLAVEAVAAMGGGAVTLADTEATLVAPQGLAPERFDEVAGGLDAALPPAFSLTAVAPDEAPAGAPRFVARADEGGVALAGRLPDERALAAARSLAEARFPGAEVTMAVRRTDGLPEGWPLRAMAGIEALALLREGQVMLEAEALTLSGVSEEPDAEARAAGLLSRSLGPGVEIALEIAHEPSPDAATEGPDAVACLASIEAEQAGRKIAFAPGSDAIEPSGLATVRAIAEILRDCPPMPLEVAGHTDTQGRASMNLALSQTRAEAVVEALARAGAPVAGLDPVGHGEARPVADESDEAGREANRRIEFTLAEPRGDPRLVTRRAADPLLPSVDPTPDWGRHHPVLTPGSDTVRPPERPAP